MDLQPGSKMSNWVDTYGVLELYQMDTTERVHSPE